MGTVRVRHAVPGDEPALRDLRLRALSDAPEAFGSTYERERARTTPDWQRWLAAGATFMLIDEARPSGLAAAVPDRDDRGIVHLMAMWVEPALRGTGAATALISAVVGWAAGQHADEVRLRVAAGNNRARRCYERNGFIPTGHETIRERDGAIEIEMARALPPSSPRSAGA